MEELKKVIITGTTGQDGSFMAEYLLKNTDHLVIGGIRRVSVNNHENMAGFINNPRFKLVDLDSTDSSNIERVIRDEKPDYFINFAANSFVGNSWDMPVNHMMTNCIAVLYQLEAIRKFAPHCRYYNAGSSEEWGDVDYSPQDEKHPAKARSPYGVSKIAARQLVKVWRESYNLFAIQGWLLNHEGVRRNCDFVTRKITKNAARIKKSIDKGEFFEPLELGNIESLRDWSDSEDFVVGVWSMLNNEKPIEYVLSSNETHSVREFVELAFEYAGIDTTWDNFTDSPLGEQLLLKGTDKPTVLMKINPEFYRPCEVEKLWGNSDRARKELGWEPKSSFKDLVKKMVENDLK